MTWCMDGSHLIYTTPYQTATIQVRPTGDPGDIKWRFRIEMGSLISESRLEFEEPAGAERAAQAIVERLMA